VLCIELVPLSLAAVVAACSDNDNNAGLDSIELQSGAKVPMLENIVETTAADCVHTQHAAQLRISASYLDEFTRGPKNFKF
jgi:hypothetical protein